MLATTAQAQTCSIPGQAGTDTAVAAQPNSFFPGTNSPAAGATSLTVGAVTGVSRAIQAGDLLLIIQMQGADINSTNTNSYGANVSGGAVTNTVAFGATGYAGGINGTNAIAGRYEWAIATNTVATTGGTLNLNSPLAFAYATRANSTTVGKQSFQVVRVPQYANATVTANLTVQAWNGSSGGILAMDVAGVLTISNRTIDGSGRGFRGGGAVEVAANGTCTAAGVFDGTGCKEYVATIAASLGGSKGEGIVGTPARIYNDPTNSGAGAVTAGTVDGYPTGEAARGAPGNAGGGGNQHNAGGGGGGNGGAGGKGGNTWNGSTNGFAGLPLGGFGGAPSGTTANVWRLGGGGGAGDIGGNGTTTPAGSGGAAGAMVILRASRIVAATTIINVNGAAGLSSATTDAAGGGGAGGTVIIAAGTGGASAAITVNANGGAGGSYTAATNVEQDGPGGGGGGGVLVHNLATAPTFNANGGARGTSTTNSGCAPTGCGAAVGTATGGSAGYAIVSPGTQVGYECLPNLDVTKATSTPLVTASTGATANYTITISNSGGGARYASVLDFALPPGWTRAATAPTYAYSNGGTIANGAETTATAATSATWTASAAPATIPAAGANTLTWSSFLVPPVVNGVPGVVTVSFVATIPDTATVGVYHNGAGVRFLDPTRGATLTSLVAPSTNVTANRTTSSYGTTTYAAYNGVATGVVGGSHYNGLVAGPTAEDVELVADFSVSKTAAASATPGSTFSYTITPRNNGRPIGSYTYALTQATDVATANIGTQLASSPLTITDTLPAGLTISTPFAGTGWSCAGSGTSTVVCTRADTAAYPIAAGTNYPTVSAVATMTATCNPSTSPRTNTVEISRAQDESVTSNNTATAVTSVTCVSTNLAVTKTNAVTALAAGSTTSYAITVSSTGGNASGSVLTDVPSAGLNCTAVTCGSATGGAVCPAVGAGAGQLSAANLYSPGAGVLLSTLPAGGSLVFTATCGVTATGQ